MPQASSHKARADKDSIKALDDYQVALSIKGDRRVFALLYKRWHPKLLRLAYRLTRNKDDAQDVIQDAAITIAKNISKLQDPSKFSAWAYTIVRRRAADHIAKAVKTRNIKTRAMQRDTSPHTNTLDDALTLKQALDRLAKPDRIILELFYIDGMSGKEMAAAMGVPMGTIKSRLFAARAKLQKTYTHPKGDLQ